VRPSEGGGVVQSFVTLVEQRGEALEDVRDLRPDLKLDLHVMRGGAAWEPPVLAVSALEGRGIDDVWNAIVSHRKQLGESGELEKKRSEQRHHWFKGLLEAGLRSRFLGRPDVEAALRQAEVDIDAQRVTPTAAAERVLALLQKE